MDREINIVMSWREWAMLLVLGAVFGGSFFFVEIAVAELPPFTIVLLRVGIAAIALQLFARFCGIRMWAYARHWKDFVGMGVLNNVVPFSLLVWGQTHIASGLASILNATTPVFMVLVAHWLIADERMKANKLLGVVLGLTGVIVMIGPELLTGLGDDLYAQIAVLGAACSYAFAGAFGRRFKRMDVPPMAVATGQVTTSTFVLLPFCLWIDQPWLLAMPGQATILSVLTLALVSTAFAYILFFRVLASAGATNLSLVTLLVPVSAIALGSLVLGERLEPLQIAGMAIIALGLIAIDGRVFARIRQPQLTAAE